MTFRGAQWEKKISENTWKNLKFIPSGEVYTEYDEEEWGDVTPDIREACHKGEP
ncbi:MULTISPECIES: hypothetical protein [unclassified Butyrivibrio]|uniref:hypothetical protein n=1 Tax=unclassified Butyrivibrio TaxID=2639466 RepID=UPI0003B34D77|nr:MULTISPECIES: hypothetical protein [unclassified Butyrivibrio]MDC7292349.1 hypothetical protein [Butyrivibrio sp. DSM 10294]